MPRVRSFAIDGPLHLRSSMSPLRRGGGDPTTFLDDSQFIRATRTPEGPATVRVVVARAGEAKAQAWGPGADWLLEQVPHLLAVGRPPPELDELPVALRDMARQCPGLRLPKIWNVFELLVPIVLEQLVTGTESRRAWRRLVQAFEEPAPGPYDDLLLPPSPAQVRSVPSDEFLSLGIHRKQGLTIRRVAERAHRIEEASSVTPREAYKILTALTGVGPWTAGCLQLYGLGHADAVPVGDYHLPNNVAWNLVKEDRADDSRMLALLEPFRPHRGRVCRYINLTGSAAPRYGPRTSVRSPHMPAWRSQTAPARRKR